MILFPFRSILTRRHIYNVDKIKIKITWTNGYNLHCEKNEMVLGRAYQPPQRRPMDLARHHLETIWQEKTSRETSQAVERRPGQILERHDMTEDSTRQGHLETTCWGLRPTTGHNGCLMMMMMMMMMMTMNGMATYKHTPEIFFYTSCLQYWVGRFATARPKSQARTAPRTIPP